MSIDILNNGWVSAGLHQIVSDEGLIADGDWVESKDQNVNGTVRLIQLADIGDGEFKNKSQRFMTSAKVKDLKGTYLKDGDILIARMPEPLGRCCIFPEIHQDAVTVVDVCLVRTAQSSLIDRKLLMYWINSPIIRNKINDESSGTTRKRITRKKIENLVFPLPALAEQKVIVDKLDDLLARVESIKTRLENIPQILKKFRQSVLISAFSGNLTGEWRSENIELKPICLKEISEYWSCFYKKNKRKQPKLTLHMGDAIGGLPETWLDTNIGYVFDVHVGATPSRNVKEYWDGDFPWVSSSEVAFCRIRSTKEKITKLGLAKTSTNLHPAGTVMLAMIGQGKTRGQAAILDIEACHNQNTAAFRVPNGFVISEFLYLFLEKQYEETRRVGGGNNQQALNKSFVQSLAFPLPPLEEQIEIVRNVEKFFHYSDLIQKKTNNAFLRINQITQSILAKAFRGELTDKWREENPGLISGINSAEALLQKIATEKLASGTTKKIVKKDIR
ncbi:restriction endonuclease subunit S [Raoultella planticola]|uniref:restriction endonuclease subunit S n=1 Tax=Raoultella planticola TaxID=575 RepID=UPI0039826FCF